MLATIPLLGAAASTPSAATLPNSNSVVAINFRLAEFWQTYKARFVTRAGRVIDNSNGGISHSEGQAYGMFFAERLGDRATFSRIWRWTDQNMRVRDDGLIAWKWDPAATPHVKDLNNATDGDLMAAWALSEAATEWHDRNYAAAAKEIAAALARTVVIPSRFGPVLLPAATGFGRESRRDGPIVNLSYWIFPALSNLAQFSPDWNAVATAGRRLIALARFGPRKLPTNWISLKGDKPSPAEGFDRVFGYDAIRIPLYLTWGDPSDAALQREFGAATSSVIAVDTGAATTSLGDPDYESIGLLTECTMPHAQNSLMRLPYNGRFYYPASLHLLALLALRDVAHSCLNK